MANSAPLVDLRVLVGRNIVGAVLLESIASMGSEMVNICEACAWAA